MNDATKNPHEHNSTAKMTAGATERSVPTRKATRREVTKRIYDVAQLLAQRIPKHQIKAALRTKFGIGARQCESYLAWAREYLVERSQRPKKDHVADAMALYEKIIRHPESTASEQMAAQAAIRQMLGLDQPTKIAPTTPDGESRLIPREVIAELPIEDLRFLSKIRARVLALSQAKSLPIASPRRAAT